MEYRIRIYAEEKIQDISLSGKNKFSIGSSEDDECCIPYQEILNNHILFFKRNGKWFVSSKDLNLISGEKEIADGDIYVLNKEKKIAVYVFGKDFSVLSSLDLTQYSEIVIGRGNQCTLILPGNNISRKHAIILKKENSYVLKDNGSLNGTFLNQNRVVQEESLNDEDEIAIGSYCLKYRQGILYISDIETHENAEKNTEYPHWIKRAPRLRKELPREKIVIDNPPQGSKEPKTDWISVLTSPIVMIIMMVVMAAVSAAVPVTLIFTLPTALLTIVMAIRNSKIQKSNYCEQEGMRLEKYGQYLKEQERKIQQLKKEQLEAMLLSHPPLDECKRIIVEKDAGLWTRRLSDNDFMSLRVGTGECDISFEIKAKEQGFAMETDELEERVYKLTTESGKIQNAPVECSIYNYSLVGVVGERKSCIQLVKNMVLQAVTHHSYEEVKIVTIYPKREKEEWEWIKWLPHSFDDGRKVRYIRSTINEARQMLKELEELLKQRNMEYSGETQYVPYYWFIFTESEMVENQNILNYILQERKNLGVGAIFLYDHIGQLPKECNVILEVNGNQGVLYSKQDISQKNYFKLDVLEQNQYEEIARTMAPLRIAGLAADSALPNCITFMEGYGVKKPEEFMVEKRWTLGMPHQSMAVPVGVKVNGEPFLFDIHEKKYGPHGLVAGMTGSGKSEMVQSWILSMALKFSPQDVSFVLIDFKGTGLILPFQKLPHLAGTISDLDHKIQRNLVALENELSRRKELLDKYGVNNINNYLKLKYAGKATEDLPFLFVIIDEFAEFKVQFPDFMPVIDRIFAIGRTLGVFAILLTQKPAGVVDDKMNANTRFRWCLKVASSADSKEMLRHPDAAKITNPGRAYVQVGEDEVYELIQSYYSGALYCPEAEDKFIWNQKVAIVEESGKRTYYENEERNQIFAGEETEIDKIVSYLYDYVHKNKLSSANQIWMPQLPQNIYLDDMEINGYEDGEWKKQKERLSAVIGMVDNPAVQKQYPLILDFMRNGHIAIFGAPGTGKTTLLQTAVMSFIRRYTPEEVNIYLMDFGGWNLGIFKDFPHVGGFASDNDELRIEKTVQLLEHTLSKRKQMFAEVGVGSVQAYEQATGNQIPGIVLVLDNFAPVLQLYPQIDAFFIRLTREGGNYGMYFMVTANNPMALGFKLNQNIKMALALQMTDKTDYQGIVGKTNGLEPENTEGRGLVKGNPPLEFQTALPAAAKQESERVVFIRQLAQEMKRKWKGKNAVQLPIMPDKVLYDRMDENRLVLGISSKMMEPVFLSENRKHYLPIVGTMGSGKTNMLKLLARQYLEEKNITVVYFDSQNEAVELNHVSNCIYLDNVVKLDEYMQNLVSELQSRKEAYESDENTEFTPLIIMIDDYKNAYDRMQEMTARRLEAIVRLGTGLNVFLYITEEADAFCRLCNQGEKLSMLMARENSAIILGGSMNCYTVFSTPLSVNEKGQALGLYEGYLLEQGKAVKMKAMSATD